MEDMNTHTNSRSHERINIENFELIDIPFFKGAVKLTYKPPQVETVENALCEILGVDDGNSVLENWKIKAKVTPGPDFFGVVPDFTQNTPEVCELILLPSSIGIQREEQEKILTNNKMQFVNDIDATLIYAGAVRALQDSGISLDFNSGRENILMASERVKDEACNVGLEVEAEIVSKLISDVLRCESGALSLWDSKLIACCFTDFRPSAGFVLASY